MTLGPGNRLGPYEIVSAIGAGGMGEVYRARDTRLERDVAVKLLPDVFAADPDRIARFAREAKTLAALNHPNIAHIYGIEEAHDIRAIVMELVDGETLADRIARGPIPVDEALPIAKQIAEALEAAHEQGIIHRDLKPANIKVTPDGGVKVLDFGLAKLHEPGAATRDPGSAEGRALSMSPTATSPALITNVGVLLGTAAYMSPEQAKGRPADKRSDIWAFGCVLFEVLTGRRAFEGEDVAETLAAVLRAQPDWAALPRNLPPHVREILERSMSKDRNKRLDVSVVRYLLNEAPVRTVAKRGSVVVVAGAVLAAILVAATLAAVLIFRPSPAPHVARFTALLPEPTPLSTASPYSDVAISPDGGWIAYNVLTSPGAANLMLRRIDQTEATPLRGISGTGAPFFSPDNRWVGFFAVGELRKVSLTGGPPVPITRVNGIPRGASWGSDDTIVFSVNGVPGLQRVSAEGGQPTQLTTADRSQGEQHILPTVLPGSRAVLFTAAFPGSPGNALIVAVDLRTGARKTVIRGGSQPQFIEPDYLVYQAAGSLMAVQFDPDRLEVRGQAVRVVEEVLTKPSLAVEFAVSRDGTLAYVPGPTLGFGVTSITSRTLMWVNRRGQEEAIDAPSRPYVYARLSPDETRVAVDIRDQDRDIWIWDLTRRTLSRLTSDPSLETSPLWTPDGRRIVFGSQRAGPSNLYWQRADGTGDVERLTTSPNNQVPSAVSRDGRQILYWEATPRTNLDLMLWHLDGKSQPESVLATNFMESNGDISTDGRWLAYESDESGGVEVYVRPFADVEGGRFQISTTGGHHPRWSQAGNELFYFNGRRELMAVPVDTRGGFKAGIPVKVLDAKYFTGAPGAGARTYDVSRDGKRFLMIKGAAGDDFGGQQARQMVVVLNWTEELKRIVLTK